MLLMSVLVLTVFLNSFKHLLYYDHSHSSLKVSSEGQLLCKDNAVSLFLSVVMNYIWVTNVLTPDGPPQVET